MQNSGPKIRCEFFYILFSTGFKGKKCECDINNPNSNKDQCKATNGKHNKGRIFV